MSNPCQLKGTLPSKEKNELNSSPNLPAMQYTCMRITGKTVRALATKWLKV